MRNLLSLFALLVIGFLGVGWYLGWYSFRPTGTEAGHKVYTIDIDTQKIGADVKKGIRTGEEKIQDYFEDDRAKAPADKKKLGGLDAIKAKMGGGEAEPSEPR